MKRQRVRRGSGESRAAAGGEGSGVPPRPTSVARKGRKARAAQRRWRPAERSPEPARIPRVGGSRAQPAPALRLLLAPPRVSDPPDDEGSGCGDRGHLRAGEGRGRWPTRGSGRLEVPRAAPPHPPPGHTGRPAGTGQGPPAATSGDTSRRTAGAPLPSARGSLCGAPGAPPRPARPAAAAERPAPRSGRWGARGRAAAGSARCSRRPQGLCSRRGRPRLRGTHPFGPSGPGRRRRRGSGWGGGGGGWGSPSCPCRGLTCLCPPRATAR